MVITPVQELEAVNKAIYLTRDNNIVWKQTGSGLTNEYVSQYEGVELSLQASHSTMILRFSNKDGMPFEIYRPTVDISKVKNQLSELVDRVKMEVEIEKAERHHPLLEFLKEERKAAPLAAEATSHIDSDLFDRPRE